MATALAATRPAGPTRTANGRALRVGRALRRRRLRRPPVGARGLRHPENHCCACGKPAGRSDEGNNPWAHARHNPCYDPSDAGVPFGKEFCPRWPSYGSSHNMSASVASRLERAARRSLRPFRRGISRAQLEAALEPRCAQRLCVGVQIVNRELFVVAPRSQACGVRPSKTSPTVNYEPACRSDKRRVTPGVYGRWMSGWNPTSLVWHWLAGMNVSDCRVGVMYGDWNGPYTRQRFVTALRLLEEAARHGAPDVELVLCAKRCRSTPAAGASAGRSRSLRRRRTSSIRSSRFRIGCRSCETTTSRSGTPRAPCKGSAPTRWRAPHPICGKASPSSAVAYTASLHTATSGARAASTGRSSRRPT